MLPRRTLLLAVLAAGCRRNTRIFLEPGSRRLPADGFSTTELMVRNSSGDPVKADFSVIRGSRFVRIEGSRLHTTVNAGEAVIRARFGIATASATVVTTPVVSDRSGDGTPDFLRLDDPDDREAFASSFAYLAEVQYFRAPGQLPAEITDCSALIRYAYRETLREHDHAWVEAARIRHPALPAQPGKYYYPFTPLGAKLFRNVPGPFRPSDILDQSFSEFADAESLRRFNAHFISRDLRHAQRGDLLFYRQPDQRSPAHAMIFVGRSQIDDTDDERLVYHTGPIGAAKGEIRRPAIQELMHHPQPQWRPLPGNSNFLGIYRWNILRQES